MNRRLCVWVVSIFTCAFTAFAHAQAGPSSPPPAGPPAPVTPPVSTGGPNIPPQAPTGDATAFAKQIREFIDYHLGVIAGADTTKQPGSRDAIRKQLSRGATSSYYSVFAKEWSDAATKVISKNPPPPMGVRLNIAIITSVLSDNGQTMDTGPGSGVDGLESLDVMLLSDSSASVALWGLKAARPMVMIRMQQPDVNGKKPTAKISAAIVGAVKAHQAEEICGFLAQDAYLSLKITDIPGLAPGSVKPWQPQLVDPILDIMEIRVGRYKEGAIPAPGAEREVATFLASQYPSIDPAKQKRMVQLMVNLEVYGGQRFDQYANNHTDALQLSETLKYVASALKVVADNRSVDTALSQLSTMAPGTTGPQIAAKTKAVPMAMQQVFKWVANPPEIPAMDPPAPIRPAPVTPVGGTPAGN